MTIRRMAETDYDLVFTLWQNTAGMGLNPADDSREGIVRYLRRNPTTCFVAEEGDALIGAILSGHDGRRAYVYHMAVAETHRRRGIGEALECEVINLQRSRGRLPYCHVETDNQASMALQRKLGLTIDEQPLYWVG